MPQGQPLTAYRAGGPVMASGRPLGAASQGGLFLLNPNNTINSIITIFINNSSCAIISCNISITTNICITIKINSTTTNNYIISIYTTNINVSRATNIRALTGPKPGVALGQPCHRTSSPWHSVAVPGCRYQAAARAAARPEGLGLHVVAIILLLLPCNIIKNNIIISRNITTNISGNISGCTNIAAISDATMHAAGTSMPCYYRSINATCSIRANAIMCMHHIA